MRLSHIMLTSLALGLTTLPAIAQDDAPPPPRGEGGAGGPPGGGRGGRGGGMPQASPEQLKAAYEAQAKYVSKTAGFSDEETEKVVMTYLDSRASQTKALDDMRAKLQDQMRQGGGGNQGAGGEGNGPDRRGAMQEEMQKAMVELNKTEKAKLQGALNGFLKPEQTAKVIDSLGSFDRQWDTITVAIDGLKLDADKQTQAMGISTEYSAALAKARDIEDQQARRDANSEARKKMNDEMKKILSEEQFTQFQRTAGGGGRGQGGPGGAGGGGGSRRPPAGGGNGGASGG